MVSSYVPLVNYAYRIQSIEVLVLGGIEPKVKKYQNIIDLHTTTGHLELDGWAESSIKLRTAHGQLEMGEMICSELI